jgi:hypothetical protein
VEETFAAAQAWAVTYPTLATWTNVGQSWEKAQNLNGYDSKCGDNAGCGGDGGDFERIGDRYALSANLVRS